VDWVENMNQGNVVRLCNCAMMCIACGTSLIPVYLTTFGEAFGGLSESELGRISSTMFLGTFVMILISGPLADRMGAKIFVLGGLTLSTLGLGGIAISSDYRMLLIASATIGMGAGVLDMIISPIVSALSVERRVSAMNRLHAFYCIGFVTVVSGASLALYIGVNWRVSVALMMIAPILVGIGFLRAPLPPLIHPDHERFGLRKLLVSPRFYVAMLMIALVGATEEGMGQWLPAYAENVLGFSKAGGGMALAGFALLMGITRLASPMIIDRIGAYGILIVSGFASGIFFAIGSSASTPVVALSACVLVGISCSVMWPTQLGVTADRFPRGGATMFGLMAASGNLGNMTAPWVEGVIAERWDLRTALLVASVSPFLFGLLAIEVRKSDRKNA
jgi:fucose permease